MPSERQCLRKKYHHRVKRHDIVTRFRAGTAAILNSLIWQSMMGNTISVGASLTRTIFLKHNMAGNEDGNPSYEDSEWSDFSGNSAKTNSFEDVPFGLRSLDPVGVINTLIACFPWQSDSTSAGISDRAPCAKDRFKFHLQVL